jgi:hypothetical protein
MLLCVQRETTAEVVSRVKEKKRSAAVATPLNQSDYSVFKDCGTAVPRSDFL